MRELDDAHHVAGTNWGAACYADTSHASWADSKQLLATVGAELASCWGSESVKLLKESRGWFKGGSAACVHEATRLRNADGVGADQLG